MYARFAGRRCDAVFELLMSMHLVVFLVKLPYIQQLRLRRQVDLWHNLGGARRPGVGEKVHSDNWKRRVMSCECHDTHILVSLLCIKTQLALEKPCLPGTLWTEVDSDVVDINLFFFFALSHFTFMCVQESTTKSD